MNEAILHAVYKAAKGKAGQVVPINKLRLPVGVAQNEALLAMRELQAKNYLQIPFGGVAITGSGVKHLKSESLT